MTKYKALLLDMNGVIIDDEHVHEIAFRQVLAEHGHELSSRDYEQHYVGRTDREGLEDHLKSKQAADLNLERLLTAKSAAYASHAARGVQAFPFVQEFVQNAASAGFELAVVTSANRDEASATLKQLDIARYMKCVVTGDDITVGKPSPEGYLKAAAILGVKPSDCIVVEDAPNGILAAKRAGMYCIGITNTHTEAQLHQADKIIDSLDELDLTALTH